MFTGPSHVRLWLSFGSASENVGVVRESPKGNCVRGPLDENRIRDAVISGVADANSQNIAGLHAVEIV
jgi:hypothetical protein